MFVNGTDGLGGVVQAVQSIRQLIHSVQSTARKYGTGPRLATAMQRESSSRFGLTDRRAA